MTKQQREKALKLYKDGYNKKTIAEEIGVTVPQVQYCLPDYQYYSKGDILAMEKRGLSIDEISKITHYKKSTLKNKLAKPRALDIFEKDRLECAIECISLPQYSFRLIKGKLHMINFSNSSLHLW